LLAHESSFIEFLETVSFRELRLIFPRGLHVFLRRLRNVCFLSARPGRRGMAPKVCRAAKQLSVIKSLQTQAVRNSRNRWRVSNMLKKHHHHHRHRHQNHITYHQFGIHFTIFHRKISRMEWKYLCNQDANVLQNNISQRILSHWSQDVLPWVCAKVYI